MPKEDFEWETPGKDNKPTESNPIKIFKKFKSSKDLARTLDKSRQNSYRLIEELLSSSKKIDPEKLKQATQEAIDVLILKGEKIEGEKVQNILRLAKKRSIKVKIPDVYP